MKIEKGTLLQDRYQIESLIGEGGMSYVYKAKDSKLGRIVALKVLKEEYAEKEDFVSKFQNEARAAAKLNHPNIVSTFDTVDEGKLHFIVMELVEGITLKEFIHRKSSLNEREAIGIALQLIDGIDTAHKMGIVHRDIKPQNIIVSTEGVVKIADFGIAGAAIQESGNASVMGSVHYISPEQARSGVSDERSDIYSFSCTLYEMLTGKPPYEGEDSMAVVFSHLEDPIPRVRDSVKDVSKALDYIVWRGMQKKASLRYQNIADMGEDLQLALEDPDGSFISEQEEEGRKSNLGRMQMDRGISTLYKVLAVISVVLIVAVFLFLGYKIVGVLHSVQNFSEETETVKENNEETTQPAITISALDSVLPEIIGKTIPEAERMLSNYGIQLYAEKEEFSEKYEEGQIISYPSGKYSSDSRIYVTVSKGSKDLTFYDPKNPADLSALQKMRLSDLEAKLKDRGISYSIKEEPSDTVESGYIIRTNKADTKEAGNLEITVSSGTHTEVYGGWTRGASSQTATADKGNSTYNKVTVDGTATVSGNVYGGMTTVAGGKASNNVVTINEGVTLNDSRYVYGGSATSGSSADNNKVYLNGIRTSGTVYGGSTGFGTANGNEVHLNGATVTGAMVAERLGVSASTGRRRLAALRKSGQPRLRLAGAE